MKITKEKLMEIIKEEVEKTLQEDGHEDVPSAVRAMKTVIEDAGEMLQALEGMEGTLPTWWTNKMAVAASMMNKMRDYLLVDSGREINMTEALQYHIDEGVGVDRNIFRPGSDTFFALFREARTLFKEGKYTPTNEEELELLEDMEIGEFGLFEGETVPLDYPMLDEAKYKGREVKLGAPGAKRSGDGKAYVFVRDPKSGNIRKVSFGSSMPDAMGDSEAARKRRKNFGDRHNCADKKDKTAPGYWACRATKMFGRNISGWW